MNDDELRQRLVALLRGMLSPAWEKPRDWQVIALLRDVDRAADSHDGDDRPGLLATNEEPIALSSAAVHLAQSKIAGAPAHDNRRRLTALVAAGTKLDQAARLTREATVDIASSGLFPVEVREEAREIAAGIDAYLHRRIASAIEMIP